jgi:hypothetical protein
MPYTEFRGKGAASAATPDSTRAAGSSVHPRTPEQMPGIATELSDAELAESAEEREQK